MATVAFIATGERLEVFILGNAGHVDSAKQFGMPGEVCCADAKDSSVGGGQEYNLYVRICSLASMCASAPLHCMHDTDIHVCLHGMYVNRHVCTCMCEYTCSFASSYE